jgi:ABC-type nickel/cobalt efflux system permease component RcnA
MLAARIYGLMCLLVMTGAVAVYLTDSFNFATTVILGFIASILAGTGLLTVYPALMTERISAERKKPKETKREKSASELQTVN